MKQMAFVTLALACTWGTVSSASDEVEKAAQTFRSGCINCHQPPDLSLKTDLAWLDQVNRTG